jgi:hypothetical protein
MNVDLIVLLSGLTLLAFLIMEVVCWYLDKRDHKHDQHY